MITVDVRLLFAGNVLKTTLESDDYEQLKAAVGASPKMAWLTLREATAAPLLVNLEALVAIEILEVRPSTDRKPGVSLNDVFAALKDVAKVQGLTYRKLSYRVNRLHDTGKELEKRSERRLATSDHNFDLLEVPGPARAWLRELERQRQDEGDDGERGGDNN